MKLKDEALWNEGLKNNADGRIDDYGGCVYYFAEHWADAMEAALAEGQTLADCAERLSHEVSKSMGQYGITGFQYGCAVSTLSATWEHGEQLRRWHNLDTQIGNEGEKANESGGVLNPALLNIG